MAALFAICHCKIHTSTDLVVLTQTTPHSTHLHTLSHTMSQCKFFVRLLNLQAIDLLCEGHWESKTKNWELGIVVLCSHVGHVYFLTQLYKVGVVWI